MTSNVEKGTKFEIHSLEVIKKVIEDGHLAIRPDRAFVEMQKGYYSDQRKGNIVFDITIELWPEGADNFVSIYFVECKDYSSNLPPAEVEVFIHHINQVAGENKKAILVSKGPLSKSAYEIAKDNGVMLIYLDEKDDKDYKIEMYRKENFISSQATTDTKILNLIKSALIGSTPTGRKKLTAQNIENKTLSILTKFNNVKEPININKLKLYLEEKEGLKFEFNKKLPKIEGVQILGSFCQKDCVIRIHNEIVNTSRFAFVFGHELGHYYLHKDLKLSQEQYDQFLDSEECIILGRKPLNTEKDWIEWQANKFSSTFFLPKNLFIETFVYYRIINEIRKPHKIFLDNQNVNQISYIKHVNYLSNFFSVSKTMIRYRLEDLGLIKYEEGYHSFYDGLKGISLPFFE